MNDLYQQIPAEKREKILQAAIREFAERGYDQASTNKIIQEAAISKGLLFHYFGNKKQLYLATFDHCVAQYMDEMEEMIPSLVDLPSDLFDRILYLSEFKYRYFLRHPLVYSFLLRAYSEISKKFPREVEERLHEYQKIAMPFILEGIDRSKFRDDLDLEKAMSLIYLCLHAIAQRMAEEALQQPEKGLEQWEEMLSDYKPMLEIFKHGVYRTNAE
ncbi:TetR/AcrR family transcriptional regulator [Lihuaxuella thermophila]|uniref:DNA-binding transcriptional regulator, AcrR family n=1 Tax=Lihuaxuella thermophila TaxID=1173111 RepID=A0A1H8EI56_9BACL|nr:TetR/AcrR family transcriptional regulator [Lihuaxuella thermophila]SEN19179.1 DNA-binding transcriptional regulator, AcrR family [Lihuaxuella thermophila]